MCAGRGGIGMVGRGATVALGFMGRTNIMSCVTGQCTIWNGDATHARMNNTTTN